METPFSLADKKILVTGASSGIGKAVAVLCARQHAEVYATARNAARLDETLAVIGEEHHAIIADLTSQEQLDHLVEQLPPLDGVVHCAGVGSTMLCRVISRAELDRVMGANFVAPVMLQTTLMAKRKLRRGASIVFVASYAASSPVIGNSLYSASKGALISYAKCLAMEVASQKQRVNCVSPAMVWTPLVTGGGLEEDELREDEKRYPLGRYGQPDDIASLAAYLLSEGSSWMTGSNIDMTGGVKGL